MAFDDMAFDDMVFGKVYEDKNGVVGEFTTPQGFGVVSIARSRQGTKWITNILHNSTGRFRDYFESEQAATKWAGDVLVACCGWVPDDHICPVCKNRLWPWEFKDEDWMSNTCHAGCITESAPSATSIARDR